MTPDTTQTDLVTAETENLSELIAGARFVLFDFDGPICGLFAGLKAEKIARELVEWLEQQGLSGLLTEEERKHPDPQVVLRAVSARHPGSDLVTELEARLTQRELEAIVKAMPTAYADPLIRTWWAMGSRLAVASNNSARTVTAYLDDRELLGCFTPHIYGRTNDLERLKPHPHALNRALVAMGADPTAALMIGDSPMDYEAAQRAGVHFLGYARNSETFSRLRRAGAKVVVDSLLTVLTALRRHT